VNAVNSYGKSVSHDEVSPAGFTSSLSEDKRLCSYDIAGSIAHVMMLAEQGIISRKEGENIIHGLREVHAEFLNDPGIFSGQEDIHMAVEDALIKKIGDPGGKMHTARSRNDQVALDLRLYIRAEISSILGLIVDLQGMLVSLSKKYETLIIPGYTHLQHAQPVLFSHHLMAHFHRFQRDIERLVETFRRVNRNPLGACAIAGTSFNIDRQYTTELLGFERPTENSMDSVSDRDFVCETIFDLSQVMMHLSALCEELILWVSREFGFIEISETYTTGSSIMPQKKNPDIPELIRGKTGLVYGDLIAVLTLMKSLPLTYNRDLQEVKPPLFNAIDTAKSCLSMISQVLSGIKVNEKEIARSLDTGFMNATDMADYLAKKGMPFREAHGITRKIVSYCIRKKKTLTELSLEELKTFSEMFEEDVFPHLTIESCVNSKTSPGGTSLTRVKTSIEHAEKILKENIASYRKISDLSSKPLQLLERGIGEIL